MKKQLDNKRSDEVRVQLNNVLKRIKIFNKPFARD